MASRTRILPVLCLAVLVAGCQSRVVESGPKQGNILLGFEGRLIEDRVPRDATLERLLLDHEIPFAVTTALIESVQEVFEPRRLKANQPYRLIQTLDGFLREFRYEINADSFLRVVSPEPDAPRPRFDVEVVEYPKEIVIDAVSTSITRERPSLIAALDEQGENVLLALQLADAFSGLIDFNSDLREDDEFRALFERVLRNGEFSGYGELRAAVMQNDGRRLTAVPFTVDGKEGWYDEDGRSLKRQFRRTPLSFQPTRTSGYGNRRHPITGNFQLHPAIDYRAAYGESVLAIGDGVVEFAAMSGASGRLIRIRHPGGYHSLYLHLSRFAVTPGQRVSQGQVIGHVGNSGRVTGTHLDFRMKKDGRYVNPLNVFSSLPPGDPIPDDLMPAFFAQRDRLFGDLDGRLAMTRTADRPNNNH